MNRRAFLTGVASAAAATAGCFGRAPVADDAPGDRTTAGIASQGFPPTVCEEQPTGGIDAVVDPAFAVDWSGHSVAERYGGGLAPDDVVVGVESGDAARAYPLSVLDRHEIVNDAFGGPLLVTYCPICRSGVVAERRVKEQPTRFTVSGLLWQPPGLQAAAANRSGAAFGADDGDPDATIRTSGNLVMVDEATGSYWSQLLAEAICGPRTGDELRIRPSKVDTWEEWRSRRPSTEVLLPPPHSGTV